MSISFNDTPNPLAKEFMEKMLGGAEFTDGKSFLYGDMDEIEKGFMGELANKAGQPVTVELHGEGEIKSMADGTRYQVTPRGWVKLDN
jgi:hypothetical protein